MLTHLDKRALAAYRLNEISSWCKDYTGESMGRGFVRIIDPALLSSSAERLVQQNVLDVFPCRESLFSPDNMVVAITVKDRVVIPSSNLVFLGWDPFPEPTQLELFDDAR